MAQQKLIRKLILNQSTSIDKMLPIKLINQRHNITLILEGQEEEENKRIIDFYSIDIGFVKETRQLVREKLEKEEEEERHLIRINASILSKQPDVARGATSVPRDGATCSAGSLPGRPMHGGRLGKF